MGDAQSAQREDRGGAAAEQTPTDTKDTPLRNNGQISELAAKAERSTEEVNGLCEEALPQVVLPPKDASEEEEEEETPTGNDEEDEAHEAHEDDAETEAKQNDLNEGFKKFFSNISLKLTVKRGSADKGETERPLTEVEPKEHGEPSESNEAEAGQEAPNNDSSSYQTLADETSEDFPGKPDKNTTETKEEVSASPDEEPPPPPSSPDDKDTPFKKFFSTGLFSGLKKKKNSTDDEVTENELMDLGRKKAAEQEIIPGVEVTAAEEEPEENQDAEEAKTSSSQDKVQSSPLKRLLSGSSFKRTSKKQRGRRSSDSRLSVSGEHSSDLQSSTESAEIRKDEAPAQPTSDPAAAEEGAWSSFKKLVTPQKLRKKSEDTSASVEAGKSAGEQTSDQSPEEGRRRKDSSVSWEAVLCGSGRRRSRKTSDSEEDTPLAEAEKQEKEEVLGGSTEASAEDEGSTWRSFKKLVTPKQKVKDEDEGKDTAPSEEGPQEESFSIKRLLSGQKKRKSVEKQAAPDEVDLEEPSGEDETPAVVPLSEFDQSELTQEGTEDQVPEEAASEPQQDLHSETQKLTSQEASANEGSQAPQTVEEPEDLTDETSVLQPLSDIPEEGVITEGAELEDTLAERLVELTSEAITAPDPTDFTLAEATEMVSAVSQLSESSKTSGSTTPMAADTEMLLQEVSETFSRNPEAVQVPPEEQSSERSAPLQILGLTADQHVEAFEDLEAQNQSLQILGSGDTTEEPCSPEPNAEEVFKVQLSENIEASEDGHRQEECTARATEAAPEMFPEEEEQPEDAEMDQREDENHKEPDEDASQEQVQILPHCPGITTEEEASSGQVDILEAAFQDVPSVIVPPEADAEEPREEPETTEEAPMAALQMEQPDVTTQADLDAGADSSEDTLVESEEPQQAAQHLTEETHEPENKEPAVPQTDICEAAEIQEVKCQDASESEKDVAVFKDETPSSGETPSPEEVPDETKQTEEHLTMGHNEEENREPADVLHIELSTASEVQEAKEAAKISLMKTSVDVPPEKVTEEPKVSEGTEEETSEADQGAGEKKDPASDDLQSPEGDPDKPKQTAEHLTDEPESKEPEPDVPEKDFSEFAEAQQTSEVESEESRVQTLMENLVEGDFCSSETAEEPSLEPRVLTSVHVEPKHTPEAFPLEPGQEEKESSEEEPVCKEAEPEEKQPQIQDLTDLRAGGPGESVPYEDQLQPEEPDGPAEKKTAVQTLKVNQQIEGVPHEAQAELQDSSAEVVKELQASSALHVSSIDEVPSSAWLLEKTMCTQTSADAHAQVSAEPVCETEVCGVEEMLEGGAAAELPASEARAAVMVDAAAMGVFSCSLRETLLNKPDLLLHEPLIGVVVGEEEFNSTLETTAPLEGDNVSESAEEASMVLMMHIPTVEYEENHRIQVPLKDVDIRSAEHSVESLVELGVTESREVIDVCNECIQSVENLSAASQIEEEVINEVAEVTFHEVVQEIQGNFKWDNRRTFEEVVFDLQVADLEPKHHKELEIHRVEQTECDLRINDHTDLEEHLEKQVQPGNTTAEEPTGQKLSNVQTHQNQVPAHPGSGSNSGMISSTRNVESPSSLSLEFKLNIQFGQVRPSAPPAGGMEAVQQVDMSESAAQNQNAVQESNTHSPQRAALQDVGIQSMELSQPVEEVQTTERGAPVVQAAEAVQPLGPKEKRSMFLGKPEPSEPKTEELPKQSEEENDQDVWLDAEEVLHAQEEPQSSERDLQQQNPAGVELRTSHSEPDGAECPSETLKPLGASDLDSEGEDFTVALEDLESRAAPADED